MYAPTAGIHEMFARQVRARPNAVAVRQGTDSITYAALSDQASRLANHLRASGVRPGSVVGVCVDRGPDLVVALLAVLQAGAAYLQLDPADPGEAGHRLRDCRVRVLVTSLRAMSRLPDTGGLVLCLELERPLVALCSPIPPVEPVRPEQPAFVWYDGGRDGLIVPHLTVVHLAETLPLRGDDTVLHWSGSTSPGAALELWAPLCLGAAVAPLPAREPSSRMIDAALEGVSVAFLPAAQFHFASTSALADLRMLLTRGREVSVVVANRLVRDRPQLRLVHCYAPPGCAVPAAWRLVRPVVSGAVPVGQWAGATRLRVLDARGQRVPLGGSGEVFVAGAGLALGYYNRPDINRELFVPDPFSADARMLRTGDYATVLPDGTLALAPRPGALHAPAAA